MITITAEAAKRLKEELAKTDLPGVRVYAQPGGCSGISYGMALDEAHDEDHVVTMFDINLYIDPASGQLLKGAEIGYEDSPAGGGFLINNPNHIPSSCAGCQSGCGAHSDDEE
ncbi:MAG TPA: iron-sulfur cluster assembly accessory protein [Firmicutes bacterium]|nr:iron-sulfur cluster assembly accessory protein [Bacillota bacterium]